MSLVGGPIRDHRHYLSLFPTAEKKSSSGRVSGSPGVQTRELSVSNASDASASTISRLCEFYYNLPTPITSPQLAEQTQNLYRRPWQNAPSISSIARSFSPILFTSDATRASPTPSLTSQQDSHPIRSSHSNRKYYCAHFLYVERRLCLSPVYQVISTFVTPLTTDHLKPPTTQKQAWPEEVSRCRHPTVSTSRHSRCIVAYLRI